MSIDPWYVENVICPRDHWKLEFRAGYLVCASGHEYPVVEGVPVMLRDDVPQTMHVARVSLAGARNEAFADERVPDLYLESLGISDEQKAGVVELARDSNNRLDPVVSYIIAATNGIMYKTLIGKLTTYPIPELRLPDAKGAVFLDLGCNWGRWCIAAAQKGYTAIGIDPSLGAIMAARRVADQLGLSIKYLVADARYLPFSQATIDTIFSYSVLQHLSKENASMALSEAARVLKPQGTSLVQMPTTLGLRCLYHQARRRFREPQDFEVRYWSTGELKKTFGNIIGDSSILVDCYFGIGIQKSDFALMPLPLKAVTLCSEVLRRLSIIFPFLHYAADSVYVKSVRRAA